MLKRMHLKKVTVFQDHELLFSGGLNVIVGENSIGKSHILKLAYATIAASADAASKPGAGEPTKAYLQRAYAEKLIGVFRPEYLGRLVSRAKGRDRCEIALDFEDRKLDTMFGFTPSAKKEVEVERLPSRFDTQSPVYLPTRELLTIYPGFVAVYDKHYLAYEETWRDTCSHLGALTLKGGGEKDVAALLKPIETALGGKVVLDENGRFYLNIPGHGIMEMTMIAEGLRKLAMLAQLVANGTLRGKTYLFWDEPEANLNPRLIRVAAQVIHALCERGVQIFIATHNLFLLRELEILLANPNRKQASPRYIGLARINGAVEVAQGEHIDDIGDIVALDENLLQSDRYLEMVQSEQQFGAGN